MPTRARFSAAVWARAMGKVRSSASPMLGAVVATLLVSATGAVGEPASKAAANATLKAAAPSHQQALLKYQFRLDLTGPSDLSTRIADASSLKSLAAQGATDASVLAARARADIKSVRAVLFDAGYYGGEIDVRIAGLDNEAAQSLPDDKLSAMQPVPVVMKVVSGERFRFGRVRLRSSKSTPVEPSMDPRAYRLISGEPAKAHLVLKAIDGLVEAWRGFGYPFARVASKKITADHNTHALDVDIEIDPGRPATYGWLNVTGTLGVAPGMVSRYSGLQPGRVYSAKDMKKAGERLRKLEAIESVRISHGKSLDSNGGVPITFAVTERKPRFVGAAVSVSTVDGGEVQAYWGHRNLFGRAERLKVEGAVSQIGQGGLGDLQYMTKTTLTIPAILDIDTDLVTEFRLAKERPDTYESHSAKFKIGLARRYSETLSGTLGIATLWTRDEDYFGTATHGLFMLPGTLVKDSRDNKLDPRSGMRASLEVAPAADVMSGAAFLATKGQLSGYHAVGEGGNVVLAGRIGAASVAGASIEDVPADMRIFAGGSGSVRGFAYRSVGPRRGGEVIGGLSLFEASGELRWRATSTIGLVTFVDVASVSPESYPTFGDFNVGAGAGVRYYTSLGPIRVDLAVPVEGSLRFSDLAVYVGLGQAF